MRFRLVTLSWIAVVGITTKVLFSEVNCDRSVCLPILKLSYRYGIQGGLGNCDEIS